MRRSAAALLLLAALLIAAPTRASEASAKPAQGTDNWNRARCLSPKHVNRVRNHIGYAPRLYRGCRRWVRGVMRDAGIKPNPDSSRGVLATALAHRFAPYGPASGSTYEVLASSPTLECSGYMMVADFLYQAMGGDIGRDILQGWDGGAVGNHAELWVDGVLLDPTVGLVAGIKLGRLRQGQGTDRILDLHHFRVAVGQVAPPAGDFKDAVRRAIRRGLFRPEDELYSVRSIEELREWSPPPGG